ncbi:tRNA pseudouridine synthase B [Camellia lanceoleosa]|nr:tRNA pseudouridine synthase B [Camellia lanceoleosa]
MFFINVDRSSNNPRFEAQTHRTPLQQFALAALHQSQRSLLFIDLEANRVIQCEPWEHIKDEDIKKTVASFCGKIWQVPPMFSAIKVGGEKMYEKARRGESIELSPRQISIFHFDIERSLDDRLFKAQLVAFV